LGKFEASHQKRRVQELINILLALIVLFEKAGYRLNGFYFFVHSHRPNRFSIGVKI